MHTTQLSVIELLKQYYNSPQTSARERGREERCYTMIDIVTILYMIFVAVISYVVHICTI